MRRWILMLACCSAAFGQLNSTGLTVTATRSLNLQPDQTSLLISVSAGLSTALSDVLTALQPAGITEANFNSVGTTFGQLETAQTWDWNFTLTVPLASVGSTIALLTTLQQALSAAANPMSLSYYVQGTSVSPQLLAANPCPYTALFSDAQTQAQQVASAAGLKLGAVTAVTDGSGAAIPVAQQAFEVSATIGAVSSVFSLIPPSSSTCKMVVQFQLR